MKLAQMFIFLVLAYLIIGVLDRTQTSDLSDDKGFTTGNFLFDMFLQPWNWTDQTFLVILGTVGVVTAGIFFGTLIFSKSDLTALSAVAAMFLAAGGYMMSTIYNFVSANVASMVDSGSIGYCTNGCFESNIISGLVVGFIGLMYVFTVLEWWAWRQTSAY